MATRVSQKPAVAVSIAQKTTSLADYTLVSQKIGVGTPIMQKPATGYTEVAQK